MSDVITQLAEKVTSQLAAGGVGLSLKADSLLGPIAGEIELIASNANEPSLEALVSTVNQYFEESNPNPFEVSTESFNLGNTFLAGIDGLEKDILPMVTGIISNIKDSIIPAANAIFETAYSDTSDSVEGGGVRLNIVTDGLEQPLFANVALASILEAYSPLGRLEDQSVSGLTFPDLPTETLQATVNSVNNSLNTDLAELLGMDSEVLLQAAYKSVFNVAGGTRLDFTKLYGRELKLKVISLLLAIGFSEEIPEGVEGVDDVGQYRAILRKTIACFALQVSNVLTYNGNLIRQDRLVLDYPASGSEFTVGAEIVVSGKLYPEWLELGGCVDAIYGSYVSERRVSGAGLLADREKYERAWVRYIATKQSSMRDNFESVFVSRLRDAIYQYGKDNGLTVKRSAIDKMFERSSSIDADNAYPFARRVIVNALFDEGEHLVILENVDAVAAASPEISLEDAVDIAITEWLVDWALDQISISKA